MKITPHKRGFTLVELLVVTAVVGILATIVYANFSNGNASTRDAKRQSDLRNIQNAIEAYKQKNGYYPAGCKGPGNWSGGTFGCAVAGDKQYIVGLAPEFISRLPFDPKLPAAGTDGGYVYVSDRNNTTNSGGTVYKLMAMNTVESETVTYASEFKSCDIRPPLGSGDINVAGWCSQVYPKYNLPPQCSDADSRFKQSYAVWGGFAEKRTSGKNDYFKVQDTTAIICK